jgi:hypothetical protein
VGRENAGLGLLLDSMTLTFAVDLGVYAVLHCRSTKPSC